MSTEPSNPTHESTEPATPPEAAAHTAPEAAAHTQEAKGEGGQEPHAPEASNASDASEGDAQEGEHGEGGEAHAEGGEGAAGATPGAESSGAPKRKRRRRKKRKPEGAQVEGAGAPATGVEGGEAKPEAHPQRPERERQERRERKPPRSDYRGEARERPAFNVGDVVFGKIIEILDEAIVLDLSGKGHAIFDRVELALPEEPAQGPGADDDDDEDDRPLEDLVAKAKAMLGQGGTPEATQEGASDLAATTPDAAAPGVLPADSAAPSTEPSAAQSEVVQAEAAPAEMPAEATTAVTEVAPAAEQPKHEHKQERHEYRRHEEPPIVVTLPPVTVELGASFVGVVHNDGGRGGLVVLTRHPRRLRAAKPLVALAFKEQTLIKGLVTGAIKGGIEVDIDGLRAFAPASHVDLRHGADLRNLIGKRLEFQVTQYGKRGRDVVLSRRSMLEAEAKVTRASAMSRLVPGTTLEGVVRSVVPFGAFVDVGGVEGLVPLSEMSHNRGDQPADVFEVGQLVEVQVQRIDVKGKIWLSRKAVIADPWVEAVKRYEVGSRHKGKVARLQPFGVFVELEPGIDGLIHTADLSLKPISHPSDVVKVGEELDVVVASTDASAHRIALHPVLPGTPEGEPIQRVVLHKMVKVEVVAIDTGGLQVRILGATGRNARGFITAAGTGTPRGTELRRVFPVGSKHDAKVIDIDPRRGEVKLSIKAMHEDSERNAYKAYKQQVSREAKFGTFADLLSKKTDKPS